MTTESTSAGTYIITCEPTGDQYVGRAQNLALRCREHVLSLEGRVHHNKRLQFLYNEHGASAFTFRILEECAPSERAICERKWIEHLSPSLNIKSGSRKVMHSRQTTEAKATISARVPLVLAKRLRDVARLDDRPVSQMVERLLREAVAREELRLKSAPPRPKQPRG